MEMLTKTPVQVIPELLAANTTRIELIEKLEANQPQAGVANIYATAKEQSKKFTAQLMSELSEFGDAVLTSVDNENEYQLAYKNVIGQLDSLDVDKAADTFNHLEVTFKKVYQEIGSSQTDLPDTLQKIVNKQNSELV